MKNKLITLLALHLGLVALQAQPVITTQPQSQSVSAGANVTLSVSASGIEPLGYQWRRNETALASETNAILTLTNVQFAQAGTYTVVVTDGFEDSITSEAAILTVDSAFTKITTGSLPNDGGGSLSCAWGDYDNDGFLDLFVTNVGQQNYLYHNNRDGTFTRITAGPIVTDFGSWFGCAWADFDNDGSLDLVAVRTDEGAAQALLYRNNGDATFTQMPANTIGGIVPFGDGASFAPVWADYDSDGFVDLFVARFGIDWLYHNNGNGAFTRITNNLVGTATEGSYFAEWVDYNNDGRPDLFVPVSSSPPTNRLSLSLDGGSFAQVTFEGMVTGAPAGCAWGDYDNDGYPDLFLGSFDLSDGINSLYHNNGDGTFTRMTEDVAGSIASDAAGVDSSAWGDYDNDGFLDLFVTTTIGLAGQNSGPNYLYHNNGNGSFTRILTGSPVNDLGASVACAWGDYDNDGFLDLFVTKGGVIRSENNGLYRNNGNSNHWLKVKCVGTVSNRSAIGAKVRAKATIRGKAVWQLREISGGHESQNALEAHFGLGDAAIVDTVRIEWPSGTVQEFHDVASKQFLTITEPPRLLASRTNGTTQFAIKGGRGFSYQIESSINLQDWSLLGPVTITNLSGIALITDPALVAGQRFYRAVLR